MAMQSDFIDLSRSKFDSNSKKLRTQTIELLIVVMFIITLLIGFGVFMNASKAADFRANELGLRNNSAHQILPGTLGTLAINKNVPQLPVIQLWQDENDNSCELKT